MLIDHKFVEPEVPHDITHPDDVVKWKNFNRHWCSLCGGHEGDHPEPQFFVRVGTHFEHEVKDPISRVTIAIYQMIVTEVDPEQKTFTAKALSVERTIKERY